MHHRCLFRILVTSLFVLVLAVLVATASAQTVVSYYWVTMDPTAPGLVVHSAVGWNWTISFQSKWTYGNNSGRAIVNATVPIEVRTTDGTAIETLMAKTNATGAVSFSYSSPTPNVLLFAPTKLVTEDGVEWNSSLYGGAYGFLSKPVTIYWDSIDTSLVSADTNGFGVVVVSVKVTYLMVPEEGLNVSQPSNYSLYSLVPKYVHDASVKINGVEAQESSVPGVYTAETSTWLPTTYVLVEVSQGGWPQIDKGVGLIHGANEVVWTSVTIVGSVCALALLAYRLVFSKRTKGHISLRETWSLTAGFVFLVAASFLSMYWALVGVEGVLHGFAWTLLTVFGIIAFALGLAGCVAAIIKKNSAMVLIAVCLPLLESTVVVKYSFDNYQMTIPWMLVATAILISTLSGVLIGRPEEQFR